jgi:hypothetical protein
VERESGAMDGHGLLLPFDTDDRQFARGFEAGRLWAALRAIPDEPVEGVIVHADNAEMAMRMAEATGRRVVGQESDDAYWITLTFEAAEDVVLPE